MGTNAAAHNVIQSEHFVTLFDSDASRASAVAAFMVGARARREPVAVLAAGPHWDAILEAAGEHAADFSRGLADGSIQFRDGAAALQQVSRGGYPDRGLFEQFAAGVLRCLGPGPVNIYGELVDMLASRGEFNAAIDLENFWNAVIARHPIRLMCGYDATHFAPQSAASRLRTVCACHSDTRMSTDDALGRWLLGQADVRVSELGLC